MLRLFSPQVRGATSLITSEAYDWARGGVWLVGVSRVCLDNQPQGQGHIPSLLTKTNTTDRSSRTAPHILIYYFFFHTRLVICNGVSECVAYKLHIPLSLFK